MAKSWSLRIGDINLAADSSGDPGSPDPETPFRILVLGNFSGSTRPASALAQRKPLLVDRDNMDEILAKVNPQVKVPLGPPPQESISISFREMEDFEPDRLFQNLPIFTTLGDLRRRLNNPRQFADAAAEIKGWASAKISPLPSEAKEPKPSSETSASMPVSGEDLLQQMLGGETPLRTESNPLESDWNRFLNTIVEPHVVARTDPRLPDYEGVVDEAISAQMRAILHHPDFQEVEAAWRGLFFLVRRLETDTNLKLYLLDVTKEELNRDMLEASNLGRTAIYQHLVERTVNTTGAQPWAVVAGLYTFGPTQADLELLGNLARITHQAGAPFLAGAHSMLVGCPSLVRQPEPREWQEDANVVQAWQQLRQLPEAAFLGLALPRFLLRLPYGKDFRTIEQFAFEEMPDGSPHDNYLWGNPALACTLLLGQSFSQGGWNMRPGKLLDIDNLPVHIYQEEDEKVTKSCAEVLLTTRAAEHLLERGLMPLLSVSGRDVVRLARFQSIASPLSPLAGRWQ
jgi:type VI secretion system protein ImpC